MVLVESLGQAHPPVRLDCHLSLLTVADGESMEARGGRTRRKRKCWRALTGTELKTITSGTYHTTWKWHSIKEKIIWGHTTGMNISHAVPGLDLENCLDP